MTSDREELIQVLKDMVSHIELDYVGMKEIPAILIAAKCILAKSPVKQDGWPEKIKIHASIRCSDDVCFCGMSAMNSMHDAFMKVIEGKKEYQALDENVLFELISVFNTRNPDRFYDPKAMAEDRQLAHDICAKFSAPARVPSLMNIEEEVFKNIDWAYGHENMKRVASNKIATEIHRLCCGEGKS